MLPTSTWGFHLDDRWTEGEVGFNHWAQIYCGVPGVPKTLQKIADARCIRRHLEYDQLPEKHVPLIAQDAWRKRRESLHELNGSQNWRTFLSMCARFELNDTRFGPGKPIAFWRDSFPQQLAWAGFARSEALRWWQAKGGVLVDIPAHRFAERSKKDGRLIWATVPTGCVIRGLVDPSGNQPLVKVVTRAPTTEELLQFEHPRMPLLEPPLWSAEPIAIAPGPNQQPELF